MNVLQNAWTYIINQLAAVTVFDLLDIAIVSIIFYYVFKFVRTDAQENLLSEYC